MDLLFIILPGLVSCLFGLKLQKVVIALMWFVIGYSLAGSFLETAELSTYLLLVIQIGVGLILGLVGMKLQKAAWFGFLFVIGLLITVGLLNATWYAWVLGIVVGIILGVFAVVSYEPMIIVGTAIVGALSVASTFVQYFDLNPTIFTIVITLVLGAIGLFIQFSSYKK